MKGGSKVFLFAGVALAAMAILLGIVSFAGGQNSDAQTASKPVKVTVVEVVRDIPAHTILTEADLLVKEVDASDAPADAVRSIADVLGRAYQEPVVKGQRLRSSLIELPGLGNEIAAGMRAMSLPVNDVSLLSGLIRDGDYVDVVFSARVSTISMIPTTDGVLPDDGTIKHDNATVLPPEAEVGGQPAAGAPGSTFVIEDSPAGTENPQPIAKVMIQDVRVLRVIGPGKYYDDSGQLVGADQALIDSEGLAREGYLILEVTPLQAEVLAFMQQSTGAYQVVARAAGDHSKINTSGITYQVLATDNEWNMPWPQPVTNGGGGEPVASGTSTPVASSGDPENGVRSPDSDESDT